MSSITRPTYDQPVHEALSLCINAANEYHATYVLVLELNQRRLVNGLSSYIGDGEDTAIIIDVYS